MLPAARAEAVVAATHRLRRKTLRPGARDTLRLEAGMNLWGQDMDESVSPLMRGWRGRSIWRARRFSSQGGGCSRSRSAGS